MSIPVDIPQVDALRLLVAQKIGHELKTHNHFIQLSYQIEDELHEHLSESTLERVWKYSTRCRASLSLRTLDVLSAFVGLRTWENLCEELSGMIGLESSFVKWNLLRTDSLEPGTRLRIGWLPDRVCIVRYLGNFRFVAEEVQNSSMQPGDSFSCMQFQLHRELYMDFFRRAGEPETAENVRYAVGSKHGLTQIEVLADE